MVFGSILGGITGSLFGSKAKPETQPTAWQSLPQEAQTGFLDMLSRGTALSNQTGPFGAAPLNNFENIFLSMVGQGAPTVPQGNAPAVDQRGYGQFTAGEQAGAFDFGRRASQQYRGADDMFSQAAGYASGAAQPITAGQITGAAGQFQNPFEELVAGRVGDAMDRRMKADLSSVRNNAGEALGNTRVGVELGQTREGGLRALGDQLAQLFYGGYQDSMNRGTNMVTGNRDAMATGAGLFSNLGAQRNNMGNSMMGARQAMQGIRSGQLQNNMTPYLTNLQNNSTAGNFIRGVDTQNQQVPVAQLDMLRQVLSSIPTGGGFTGGTDATTGLFGSGGMFNGGGNFQKMMMR